MKYAEKWNGENAEKNLSGKKTGENQSKAKHYCS